MHETGITNKNSWLVSDFCYSSLIFKNTFHYIEIEFSRIFNALVEDRNYNYEEVNANICKLFRSTIDTFFHCSRLATYGTCECGVKIKHCFQNCNGRETHCMRVVLEATYDIEAELMCLAEASGLLATHIDVPREHVEKCVHEILSYGCSHCSSLLLKRCMNSVNPRR